MVRWARRTAFGRAALGRTPFGGTGPNPSAGADGAGAPKGPLGRASGALLRVEAFALTALMAVITGLILLNVVTRTAGMALFWVDELAIYAMIWAVLIGASMQLRLGAAIAVDLLPAALGARGKRALRIVVAAIVLGFALALGWLSWVWYDPLGLAAAGFDTGAFSGATFNFIYQEPTVTVGIPKFWIWLIVPVVAVAMSVHAAANLVDAVRDRPLPALEALKAT